MLPSSKSNRIAVDGARYRYIVSESGTVHDGIVPLAVTVQLPDYNGTYLRVLGLTARRMPEEPTKFYMGRTLDQTIKPRHVARLIRLGLARGWEPRLPGPAVIVQISNSEVFAVDCTAWHPIACTRPQQDAEPGAAADGGGM